MYENKALDPGGRSSSARMKPHVSGMHLSIDDDVSDYGRVEPGSAGGRLLPPARTYICTHSKRSSRVTNSCVLLVIVRRFLETQIGKRCAFILRDRDHRGVKSKNKKIKRKGEKRFLSWIASHRSSAIT